MMQNRINAIKESFFRKRNMKKFYSGLISKNDLVFDIGANIGSRTSVFLDIGAKVVAVEPNPNLARRLKKKFKYATIIDKAIGGTEGKVLLHLNESDVLSSTSEDWIESVKKSGRFGELANKFNKKIEVEQITIDYLVNKFGTPKFVKIDTEGTELEIIKVIDSCVIGCISFEFAIPESKEVSIGIINHLNLIGFKLFNISFGESMEFLSSRKLNISQLIALIDNLPEFSWGDVYAFSE
ncbi:FkbM family methyltransferase [Methylophaga sp.]|uniref:FkbM family methyltransferase n=1 Tax=Methylophaga sp. TaxID=2024840 RepID=UPI003A8FE3D3